MRSPENFSDEPLTPAGRLFLRPELNTIIHSVVGVKDEVNVEAVKAVIKDSVMLQHPRFCSLLVRDRNGLEHWRRTQVEIDRHVFVVTDPVIPSPPSKTSLDENDDVERRLTAVVNQYVAELSLSTPLSTDKPLWEIHLLVEYRCAVLRVHHALGDGISLMSMFLACCRRKDDGDALPSTVVSSSSAGKGKKKERKMTWRNLVRWLWGLVTLVWFNIVFAVEFVGRGLWVRDRKTPIAGGAGVELWPRKLATARFSIHDMKLVKSAIAKATVNDVLFAVVSSGLSKYLEHQSSTGLQKRICITGTAMVNLREQPGLQELCDMMKRNSGARWGNKFGMILLPIYCQKAGADPLQYLKSAKAIIDRKKQSIEAHFSYKTGDLVMSLFGPKYASWLNYRILCNTTFTISNVIGPQEEITIAGNPVTYLRANTSSLPHALTMHMVSYAGKADLQILVAKDIIPDPEFLAKCFEDSLLEMKEAAIATTKT